MREARPLQEIFMNKIALVSLATVIIGFSLIHHSIAADFKEADELFEKGTFQTALEEYDQIAKVSKDSQEAFKAFYRGCESLAFLYRYGEAMDRIHNYKGTLSLYDQSRFLALKVEMLRNFLMQYGGYQRNDVIDVTGKEVFRLTPKEIKKEIAQTYSQLWDSRQELIKIPLKQEEYFFDLKNVDFGMYPTFLDYVVQSWLGDILQGSHDEKNMPNPEALPLLADEYQQPLDMNDQPGVMAAELIEALIRLHGNDQSEARERWKIMRLALPIQNYSLYSFPKDKFYYDYALMAKDVLLRWAESFKNPEAKAEALYQSAFILNIWTNSKLEHRQKKAHDLCLRIENEFSQSKMKARAQRMRQQIEMSQLYLQAKPEAKPGANEYMMTTKNINEVYFRIYSFDPSRAKDLNKNENGYRGFNGLFNSWPYPLWGKKLVESDAPLKAWRQEVKDTGDYENINNDVHLPSLDKGMYLLLASTDKGFKFGTALLSATVVNVSDLMLLATIGVTDSTRLAYNHFVDHNGPDKAEDEISRLYVADASTGKAIDGVAIDVLNLNENDKLLNFATDIHGLAAVRLPINLSPYSNNYMQFDALAHKGGSFAVFQQPIYFNYSSKTPYEIFIETDRPIYRPGDKVQAKVIVVKHTGAGLKTVDSGCIIKISASDANGKEFFTQDLTLNDFGSSSTKFDISSGRLLGQYRLSASYEDGRFHNSNTVNFTVEEYKRPEFEIALKEADKPWKYNEPVDIQGSAKYYFGGAVPDAPMSYKIRRQWYVPYCYRYWFGRNYAFDNGGQEIASGQVKTDKEGKFSIAFTPTPSGNKDRKSTRLNSSH